MNTHSDTNQELISWEDRLERARLRRTGFPAGVLLFTILALILFWNHYSGESWLRASLTWILAFGAGLIVFLGVNELTSRRTIQRSRKEIKELRERDSLDTGSTSQ